MTGQVELDLFGVAPDACAQCGHPPAAHRTPVGVCGVLDGCKAKCPAYVHPADGAACVHCGLGPPAVQLFRRARGVGELGPPSGQFGDRRQEKWVRDWLCAAWMWSAFEGDPEKGAAGQPCGTPYGG